MPRHTQSGGSSVSGVWVPPFGVAAEGVNFGANGGSDTCRFQSINICRSRPGATGCSLARAGAEAGPQKRRRQSLADRSKLANRYSDTKDRPSNHRDSSLRGIHQPSYDWRGAKSDSPRDVTSRCRVKERAPYAGHSSTLGLAKPLPLHCEDRGQHVQEQYYCWRSTRTLRRS